MGSLKIAPTKWTYQWVPRELMLFLAKRMGIETFVETGTEFGSTALWASQHFKRVCTCEASAKHFDIAQQRLKNAPNVYPALCESMPWLAVVMAEQPHAPMMYWLDAHWTHAADPKDYYGADKPHPLLAELEAIVNRPFSQEGDCILIDDARFIVYPFTAPGSEQKWPDFRMVIWTLSAFKVAIYGDCIIAIPPHHEGLLLDWKREIKGTELDLL